MTEYNIERWDVILVNNQRTPIIYIKPDLDFVEFIRRNNYKILVQIKDTKTVYDNKKTTGTIDQSAFIPNCRPNFYDETGFYIVTLNSSWNGYPAVNRSGKAIFYGY